MLDANILVRAVLGVRVRGLFERYGREDWPVLACALTRNCPIWTEDQDFFGAGVPTWTTDRIELFLAAGA